MALMRKALPEVVVPQEVFKKNWVVYCKPSAQGPQKLLEYLGRYVHRIALSNARIVALTDDKVTFSYTDSTSYERKLMTLTPFEFIRRFLQHVLPRGFHKFHYYGLLSPSSRPKLKLAQALLVERAIEESALKSGLEDDSETPAIVVLGPRCPACKKGHMVLVQWQEKHYLPVMHKPP